MTSALTSALTGPRVAGVVLAAGTSSRLAGELPKQLLELGGRPLLRRVAIAALGSRLAEVIVVLGHHSERVAAAVAGLGVKIVVNHDFRHGQSTSVRAGLAHVEAGARGALFMPADQPLLSSRLIDRLIDVYASQPRHGESGHGESGHGESGHGESGPIVVPTNLERRAAPVLFDRSFFAELEGLNGDVGGRALFEQHPSRIVEVAIDDALELADIDTEADLRRLERIFSRTSAAAQSDQARK